MKKLILASVSALALFGVAACSDSTDNTTTQSTTPPPAEQPMAPATPEATPPADGSTSDHHACACSVNACTFTKKAGFNRPFSRCAGGLLAPLGHCQRRMWRTVLANMIFSF